MACLILDGNLVTVQKLKNLFLFNLFGVEFHALLKNIDDTNEIFSSETSIINLHSNSSDSRNFVERIYFGKEILVYFG